MGNLDGKEVAWEYSCKQQLKRATNHRCRTFSLLRKRLQATSNARHVATLAGLETCTEEHFRVRSERAIASDNPPAVALA